MIVFDSVSSGFPVIRFVRKFFNYTRENGAYVGMALPLFKGADFTRLSGCRNPGSYICAKLNTKINEG